MLYIVFLILQLLLAVFIFYLSLSFATGAPFVPTQKTTAEAMIRLADIQKNDTVYDLGSGDGRLLFLAAQKGAHAVGIEINPYLVLYTNICARLSPFRNTVKAHLGNLWTFPISGASVVFIYLLPWNMKKLQEKIRRELAPGARIVTNSFLLPDFKPVKIDASGHVYLYIVPR